MNTIITKQELSANIKKLVVEAPVIAKKALAGQFVIIIVDQAGERIPLTIVECDQAKGTITLILQEVGTTTFKLGALAEQDELYALLGPLGKPTHTGKIGTVVTIGGGVGIAEIYPVTKAFKQANNRVISIIGARSRDLLILENELKAAADELIVATDDGSYGLRGNVCAALKQLIKKEEINLVYAVGPVPMMRSSAELTRSLGIKTLVSLNPIMVDATGMCGVCRVCVDGQTKFACVDGPEFDAHLVDFADLTKRLSVFSQQEKQSLKGLRR